MRSVRNPWLAGSVLVLGGVLAAAGCYNTPVDTSEYARGRRRCACRRRRRKARPAMLRRFADRRPGLHDVLQLLPQRPEPGGAAVRQLPERRRPHARPRQPDRQGIRQADGVPAALARRAAADPPPEPSPKRLSSRSRSRNCGRQAAAAGQAAEPGNAGCRRQDKAKDEDAAARPARVARTISPRDGPLSHDRGSLFGRRFGQFLELLLQLVPLPCSSAAILLVNHLRTAASGRSRAGRGRKPGRRRPGRGPGRR